MKILIVAPFIPWPLAHGGRIRLFHLVRQLALRHEVTLVCLADDPGQELGPLPEICHEVVAVAHRPRPVVNFFRFLFGPNSYNVERFVSQSLTLTIKRLMAAARFDLVHLETTHIWSAAAACGSVPVVLGTQNVESRILAQLQRACRNPVKRLLYLLEAAKMRHFEENAWRSSHLCLTVSEDERREIIGAGVAPERVVTVPNGVDLGRFEFRLRPGHKKMLFLAGLDYLPNMDAARWLMAEVWPLLHGTVPSAELLLAGRKTEELVAAGLPQGVTCLGDPADVPACFAMADALLVPLRIGAGTRLKVLEAMAAGLPVVTTSIGCEGLDAGNGEHLLVADSAKDFADAAGRLLEEPGLSAAISSKARRLVEERYSWERITEDMMCRYDELARLSVNGAG